MNKILLFCCLVSSVLSLQAAHISGGEMYYTYIGPGSSPNTLRYSITMRLFRDCSAGGANVSPMPASVIISVFSNADDSRFRDVTVSRNFARDQRLQKLDFSCIQSAPEVCYDVGYFNFTIDLPKNADGYTCSFQTCCRVAGINNIQYNFNSTNGSPGVTVSCKISGTNLLGQTGRNSSPVFKLNDTALVCANNFFTYDFSADDDDFDSLSYSFCDAFGCSSSITNALSVPSGAPSSGFFPTLTYTGIYNGFAPLGSTVSIDPITGIISGIPTASGKFVIDVCINEWRNGIVIGSHRKDFILKVADCNITKAELNPQYFTCDGFTLNFSNNAPSQSGTGFEWTFGDTASGINNISISPNPVHTFSDTGIYIVKLKVSVSGICEDSTTSIVKVYPGFFPAFNIDAPYCKGIPIKFNDLTTTRYGVVDKWRWDFGNTVVSNDTSVVKNPFYTYPVAGNYTIKLVVGNSFGCLDSTTRNIVITNSPSLKVTADTTYCGRDSVTLTALGTGVFSWQPNTRILGANTATPLVFPSVPTKYYVTLNQSGCIGRDSVTVKPANNLTTSISASATSICEDDTILLTANSNYVNGLTWTWTPANAIVAPANTRVVKAFPKINTTYFLTTRWGRGCVANDTKSITVKPLAMPDAGLDKAFCRGQGQAQLLASGGTDYRWEPALGLDNSMIPNPISTADTTTVYKVFVGVAGCSAKKADSVKVLVRQLPITQLTNDTLICSIDTLQLKTSGVGSFQWSPNYMISSLTNPFPLVSPDVPTKYYLRLTDRFGCVSSDSVFVDVKLFVTIDAGNDTTICRTDGFLLNTNSDALSYKWTPSTYLSSDTAKRPLATPLTPSITYRVVGNIGKCQSNDQVTIQTVPYPAAKANDDTTICFGATAFLRASGGSFYSWTPINFLSATNTPLTQSVKPRSDIQYIVTVRDTLGCPKAVKDSVWVRVYPVIRASTGLRDTSIVVGESLQLNGSGGNIYLWTPSAWLNNPNGKAPIATPESNIEYSVLVTAQPPGCSGTASVKIKVFQLPPSLYVPTVFSPNGDNSNDLFFPKPLGIRKLKFFKIYNRWGQLVFETNELNRGWDGRYKGNPQDPGTFVWQAEAETYKGETIYKKGYVVLVR